MRCPCKSRLQSFASSAHWTPSDRFLKVKTSFVILLMVNFGHWSHKVIAFQVSQLRGLTSQASGSRKRGHGFSESRSRGGRREPRAAEGGRQVNGSKWANSGGKEGMLSFSCARRASCLVCQCAPATEQRFKIDITDSEANVVFQPTTQLSLF